MDIKSRIIYVKGGRKVKRYIPTTNRRFFARCQAWSGERYRILVRYHDREKEYDGEPLNDSGWYTDKKELIKTARAFFEEEKN